MECGSEATNIRTVSRFAPRSSLGIPADRRRGDDAFARFPASYNEEVAGFQRPLLQVSWLRGHAKFLEAPPGFEPGVEVLQTSALPLGDGAPPAVRAHLRPTGYGGQPSREGSRQS